MATKPDDRWPADQQTQELSKYEKAFYRVMGACVCVVTVALTATIVATLTHACITRFSNGGAA